MGGGAAVRALACRAAVLLALGSGLTAGPDEREADRPSERAGAEARPALSPSQAPSTDSALPGRETPATLALERGLAFLAGQQATRADGSYPQPGLYVPVAVTALSSLAFMAGGSVPERGPYGHQVARGIDYLLAHCDLSEGSVTYGYIQANGAQGRNHAHGFATLALSQAWSMSPQRRRGHDIRKALEASVERIRRCQAIEGGWYYEPVQTIQHENSVTICFVQALRGARNAGVLVDPAVIGRAVEYVKRCQNDDGSFRYALGPDHKDTLALTAAAVATLNSLGEYSGPVIDAATEHLWRGLFAEGRPRSPTGFPRYERLYLAQALWQNPDRRMYERWWRDELPAILAEQKEDGSWSGSKYGPCYDTAMSCLVLAIPLGLLPIFQR